MPDRRTPRHRWFVVGGSAAAVLVLASGYAVALGQTSDDTGQYRTARVGLGPVESVLTLTGSVSRLNQLTATFPATGTVGSVSVQVGQRVKAGDVLATMDPTALQASLLDAEATLAQAEASLEADESSTSATSSSTSASTSASASSSASSSSGSGAGGAGSSSTGSSSAARLSTGKGSTGGASSRSSGSSGSSTPSSGSHGGTSNPRSSGGAGAALDLGALRQAQRQVEAAMATQQTTCAPVLGNTGTGNTGSGNTGTAQGRSGGSGRGNAHPASFSLTGTPQPTGSTANATSSDSPDPSGTIPSPTSPTTPATTLPTESPTESRTPTGVPDPTTTTPAPTGTTQAGPSESELAACAAALRTVANAQQVATAQLTRLAGSVTRLAQQVAAAAAAAAASQGSQGGSGSTHSSTGGTGGTSGTGGTGGTGSQSGNGSTGGSGSGRSSSGGSGSGGVGGSAGSGAGSTQTQSSRIASDRVAILEAQASVDQAQANLDGATLKAPINGVVASVGFVHGQTATASEGVVIVGDGAAQVTVDVPLADVKLVTPGLKATVTAAGGTRQEDGSVTSVDLLPAAGSTSATPTYPAKVVVPNPSVALASGSTATVSVDVGGSTNTLRVPVSAVAGRTGGSGTVSVMVAGTPAVRNVVLGAVGGGYAQVLSGLKQGDAVVIADVAAAIPTNTTGLRGLGGGGFVRNGTGGASGGAGAGTIRGGG